MSSRFHISAQNIDCGYSLEPSQQGDSNEYPQSMFSSKNKKNNVCPCKPQFYYIKVGFKGSKVYRHIFVMKRRIDEERQNYIGMFSWWKEGEFRNKWKQKKRHIRNRIGSKKEELRNRGTALVRSVRKLSRVLNREDRTICRIQAVLNCFLVSLHCISLIIMFSYYCLVCNKKMQLSYFSTTASIKPSKFTRSDDWCTQQK